MQLLSVHAISCSWRRIRGCDGASHELSLPFRLLLCPWTHVKALQQGVQQALRSLSRSITQVDDMRLQGNNTREACSCT